MSRAAVTACRGMRAPLIQCKSRGCTTAGCVHETPRETTEGGFLLLLLLLPTADTLGSDPLNLSCTLTGGAELVETFQERTK